MSRIRFAVVLLAAIMMMSACSSRSMAQNEEGEKGEHAIDSPPELVAKAFRNDEAKATNETWFMDGENFEVEFKADGMSRSAVYSPDGHLLESESEISTSDLPASITEYIRTHYAESRIVGAETSRSDEGTVFEVVLSGTEEEEDEEGEEGEGAIELVFDADGNFVSREEVNEDDADDDDDGEDDDDDDGRRD